MSAAPDLVERLSELAELGHAASPGFIREVAEEAIAALLPMTAQGQGGDELVGLKPCPFCGCDDPEIYPTGDASRTVQGGCRNPDCAIFDCFPGSYTSRAHFAEWWNHRAADHLAASAGRSDVVVPREPTYEQLAKMAWPWACTVEEMAETWAELLDVFASDTRP